MALGKKKLKTIAGYKFHCPTIVKINKVTFIKNDKPALCRLIAVDANNTEHIVEEKKLIDRLDELRIGYVDNIIELRVDASNDVFVDIMFEHKALPDPKRFKVPETLGDWEEAVIVNIPRFHVDDPEVFVNTNLEESEFDMEEAIQRMIDKSE